MRAHGPQARQTVDGRRRRGSPPPPRRWPRVRLAQPPGPPPRPPPRARLRVELEQQMAGGGARSKGQLHHAVHPQLLHRLQAPRAAGGGVRVSGWAGRGACADEGCVRTGAGATGCCWLQGRQHRRPCTPHGITRPRRPHRMCLRSLSVKLEGVSALSGMACRGSGAHGRGIVGEHPPVPGTQPPSSGAASQRAPRAHAIPAAPRTSGGRTSMVCRRTPDSTSSSTLSPSSPDRASFST